MLVYIGLGLIIIVITLLACLYVIVMNEYEGIPWRFAKVFIIFFFIWLLGFFSFIQYGGMFN